METWGCGFCGQLFLAKTQTNLQTNLQTQVLRAVDPSIARIWFWNGRQWQRQPEADLQPVWLWQGLSILLVMLPTTLIGVSAYLFPTDPHSVLHEFPIIWTGVTFCAHLVIVIYLLTEYYQIPFLAYRQGLRRLWGNHHRP